MNVSADRAPSAIAESHRTSRLGSVPASMVPHPQEEVFSVLVVDDHQLPREAIAARLAQMGAGIVHEAASVAEARAHALASGPCDLAILDLGLTDGSGIDLVTELRTQGWPRIVVLSSSDDPYAVQSAFQSGATAYLLKSASPMVVTDGVRRVLDGGVYADPGVAAADIESLLRRSSLGAPGVRALSLRTSDETARKILAMAEAEERLRSGAAPVLAAGTSVPATDNTPKELSAREVEMLQLVADGRSNKEIGDALNLPALRVKSHLSRIGRKLGTGDRAQMIALAMRTGVIR